MNQHTYTEHVPATTRIVVENLPEGKFLDKDEILQEGDLALNACEKSRPTICPGRTACVGGGKNYYRPIQYYYLKEGETLKEGDEWQYYNGWGPIKQPEFADMHPVLYSWHVGSCRRKIVKKKEEPKPATKFKVGDKVKILHKARQGQRGVITKIRENYSETAWRNEVKLENGDRPPYADSELELVEENTAEPKFKVGQTVKILLGGRKDLVVTIASSVPQMYPHECNNAVNIDGLPTHYGDHELELVEEKVTEPVKPSTKAKWRELGPDEIIQKGDQGYAPPLVLGSTLSLLWLGVSRIGLRTVPIQRHASVSVARLLK
jgi:transcription antitermination factor NusG